MGTQILIEAAKLSLIFIFMIQAVPILVWLERRGSAFMQNRFGPNRVGPFGLVQTMADAVKFAFKEEFAPEGAKKIFFYAAPILALIPAALAMGALPFSVPIDLGTYVLKMQGYDFGIGLIIVLGVSSLSAYSLLLAGWSSGNKFSLMGALRACAQMISYELGLGLSLVGILMLYGTFSFNEMIEFQRSALEFNFFGDLVKIPFLPNWGIFYQPLGFVLFLVSIFAESNRLPFDLPEAEAELVAGFHTEYGGLKMLMFYMGEYGHMIVGASLSTIIFFGGYDLFFVSEGALNSIFLNMGLTVLLSSILVSLIFLVGFGFKVSLILWFFIWVRWTLPRFRYDQLMSLGWKTILPWGLFNTVLTAAVLLVANP